MPKIKKVDIVLNGEPEKITFDFGKLEHTSISQHFGVGSHAMVSGIRDVRRNDGDLIVVIGCNNEKVVEKIKKFIELFVIDDLND